MAGLGEFLRRRRADFAIGGIGARQLGKGLLKRGVAPAQRVIVRVGNDRRVFPVIAPVMLGDFRLQPRVLFLRLGKGQLGRFRLRCPGAKFAQGGGR